ncbi:hypothetical protein [Actinoplanes sp. NPDC026670]|uniref:hypothetical protein n=1 Tax=Actinoplanes sp. NPDC026670 TaxID=3154700 RepID=UPI003406CDCC
MCIEFLGGGSSRDYPSPLEALLPTLDERVTRLERDMADLKRLRASQDSVLSDFGEKLRVQHELIQAVAETQSEHTALLNRHTAMHRETGVQLAGLKLDVFSLKGGVEQIIGMLDTVIEQGRER